MKIYALMVLLVLALGVSYAKADCQVVTIFDDNGDYKQIVVCTDD